MMDKKFGRQLTEFLHAKRAGADDEALATSCLRLKRTHMPLCNVADVYPACATGEDDFLRLAAHVQACDRLVKLERGPVQFFGLADLVDGGL